MFVSGQWWIEQVHRTIPSAIVLTAFVCAIAYVRSSRLKALIYSLPVPFTCAYIATSLPINATYLTGLILVVGYNWAVYWLHIKLRVPLLIAIVASAGTYFVCGMLLRPMAGVSVGLIGVVGLVGWFVNLWLYRPLLQPDHRGRTPWWLKAPLIFVIAVAIYNATRLLAGAVGTFPYAGVFTSYEMRHSLRTLAGQFTINVLGILMCMLVIAATEAHLPAPWPILLGWIPVIGWMAIVHRFAIGRPEVEIEE